MTEDCTSNANVYGNPFSCPEIPWKILWFVIRISEL